MQEGVSLENMLSSVDKSSICIWNYPVALEVRTHTREENTCVFVHVFTQVCIFVHKHSFPILESQNYF